MNVGEGLAGCLRRRLNAIVLGRKQQIPRMMMTPRRSLTVVSIWGIRALPCP